MSARGRRFVAHLTQNSICWIHHGIRYKYILFNLGVKYIIVKITNQNQHELQLDGVTFQLSMKSFVIVKVEKHSALCIMTCLLNVVYSYAMKVPA